MKRKLREVKKREKDKYVPLKRHDNEFIRKKTKEKKKNTTRFKLSFSCVCRPDSLERL